MAEVIEIFISGLFDFHLIFNIIISRSKDGYVLKSRIEAI